MIDANSAPVWAAAITMIGGILTLIIQGIFASRARQELANKVEQVHVLANSTASAGLAREATQAAVIQELRAAGAIAQTDKAVAAALSSPNHTGGDRGAVAVADAAVAKKDEILGDRP